MKDNELVDGNYEQDLQDAIMLSKLDYEEKKNIYKQNKKDAEQEKKENGKKKKNKAMTLEQFNSFVTEGHTVENERSEEVGADGDGQFFERINAVAKEVFTKEQKTDRVGKGETKKVPKEQKVFNNETITIAQMQVHGFILRFFQIVNLITRLFTGKIRRASRRKRGPTRGVG